MHKCAIRNQQGHILLQLLLIMPFILILIFLPLNFSFVQHKRNILDAIMDKALQRAAVQGGITPSLRCEIMANLETNGFKLQDIEIIPVGYEEKMRGEIIEIKITVPGNPGLLQGVTMIGGNPLPDEWRITASGSIMSEKL